MPAPRLLIADDQPDILEALKLLLKGEGFDVETATSPRAVLAAVEARDFDALLVDMNYTRDTTSGAEGLDLLSRIQALESAPPVVVMTAWGSIDGAVEAMRRGARDYVEKPWDNRRLITTLRTQVELGRALRKSQRLELENRTLRKEGLPEVIAESPAMQPVLRLMERVGPSDANVLLLGEHGTGKEVIARWLHASSGRSERAMIAVNLGGIPDGLFESELFGHVRGAFTDAKADRICRCRSRRSCCACSRPESSSALAHPAPAGPTCASLPPPTPTSTAKSKPAASAKICCSGSTPSRFDCRPCGIAGKTFRCSRRIFSGATPHATTKA